MVPAMDTAIRPPAARVMEEVMDMATDPVMGAGADIAATRIKNIDWLAVFFSQAFFV